MHQTQWSPERPLPPPVSLASQSHPEKPPEVYNEAIIKNKFNSYQEFLTYIQTVKKYVEQCDLPVAYNLKFTFEGDEDAGVPGVITGAKKETKEEQNPEEDKEYQKILNSVEDIKNATNAEEVAKNYGDTKEKVDKSVDQIQNNIKDQDIKDYLDKHFLNTHEPFSSPILL